MSWRKIRKDDIQRGVVIKMGTMINTGAYGMAMIVHVAFDHIKVARPYAYAHKDFNTNQPLLGVEVFAIGMDKLLSAFGDYEVYETISCKTNDQYVAKMAT